jgi:hypothetical protein
MLVLSIWCIPYQCPAAVSQHAETAFSLASLLHCVYFLTEVFLVLITKSAQVCCEKWRCESRKWIPNNILYRMTLTFGHCFKCSPNCKFSIIWTLIRWDVSHFSNLRAKTKNPFFAFSLADPRKFMFQVEKPTAISIYSITISFLYSKFNMQWQQSRRRMITLYQEYLSYWICFTRWCILSYDSLIQMACALGSEGYLFPSRSNTAFGLSFEKSNDIRLDHAAGQGSHVWVHITRKLPSWERKTIATILCDPWRTKIS